MSEGLFPRVLKTQVATCRELRPVGARITMRFFSGDVQKQSPEDSWAGIFKFMVLHAFRLDFPAEKVAAICRGLGPLSGLEAEDVENLSQEIASGKFRSNDVDKILSEHYKIDDLVFPETDSDVWFGNAPTVVKQPPTTTALPTEPKTIKSTQDGLEAFQVGM